MNFVPFPRTYVPLLLLLIG